MAVEFIEKTLHMSICNKNSIFVRFTPTTDPQEPLSRLLQLPFILTDPQEHSSRLL